MHPFFQQYMPQHAISRLAGWLANSENNWLKNQLIRYFINRYPVNMDEAEESNAFRFNSYNAFFTRSLKPGLRPIAEGANDFVSPADGVISQIGNLEKNKILQAKNHQFTVTEVMGGNETIASPFTDGAFITIYLAPHDYHRVHMPIDGTLTDMIYIPGKLFSVNFKTAECTPKLFARNERVVSVFNTAFGRVAVILVGAMIVGSIETVWAGTVTGVQSTVKHCQYTQPIHLKKGEEMGRFKLGSTVILLLEKEVIHWQEDLKILDKVLLGQKMGLLTP